jgi:DNA integrity scanning protein DisA with diadenylate cyclase activity
MENKELEQAPSENDLISAIVENLKWILRTDEMITLKRANNDLFGVEQYAYQKNKLLNDLKELYAELNVGVEFHLTM